MDIYKNYKSDYLKLKKLYDESTNLKGVTLKKELYVLILIKH